MSRRHLAAVVAGAVSILGVTACDDGPPPSGLVHVEWHEVTLPSPPGRPGRIAIRDATACDGTWYVVGAVIGREGSIRPAAWTSHDARTWRSVAIEARDYYPKRSILRSVACRDGRMAAVGSRSGGAHGNARTASWYQRPDGTLIDMRADWTLYGGADAISVNRIAAGPDGWLIDGNRRSGAAVWVSADATDFRLVDDDPALSSDAAHTTAALDEVHDGLRWTVVGRFETPGRVSPAPLAWTSTDGTRWSRESVPAGTHGFADLERVVVAGDNLLAAGVRANHFGTWIRADGRWRVDDAFGTMAKGATQPFFVSGLVADDDGLVAAVSDGARFQLWAGRGSGQIRQVLTPTSPRSTGDTKLTVAADGETVLLLADDGTSGRAWIADWNTLGR